MLQAIAKIYSEFEGNKAMLLSSVHLPHTYCNKYIPFCVTVQYNSRQQKWLKWWVVQFKSITYYIHWADRWLA